MYTQNLVEVRNIKKGYGAGHEVYNNLNLTIQPGRIIGLLGPNGSGKTTLLKMLAGILTPDAGEILINGNKVGPATKAQVAYLSERTYFNESLKVKSAIQMFSDFYKDFDEHKAYQMFQNLGIDVNAKIKTLSKGNKEKVQLVMVMSRNANLYLLDEPIAGVDPAARDFILNTILSNYNRGATLILSTHLITDVERILDEVIMVKNGYILTHESAQGLRQRCNKSIDQIFREEFRC